MTKKSLLLLALLFLSFPANAGLIVNDTFTEAVDTNIESHTADSGGGWAVSNAAGMVVVAATDKVRGNNAAVRRAINATSVGTPDMVVTADLAVTSNTSEYAIGLIARNAAANTYTDHTICRLFDDTAGAGGNVDFEIYNRVDGDEGTDYDLENFNGTIGTSYTMTLKVVGTKTECCIGTNCASFTNTEISTGNYAGLYTIGSSAATGDNFKAYNYNRAITVD